MIVKKYQGTTEEEAVKKAQEDLGNSAVVLNVKELKQRGIFRLFKKDVVEITAALEEDEFKNGINKRKPSFTNTSGDTSAATSEMGIQTTPVKPLISNTSSGVNLVADEKIDVKSDSGSAMLEQKLDVLHNLLQSQINQNAEKNISAHNSNKSGADGETAGDNNGKSAVAERENTNMKFIKLIYKKLVDNEVDEKYADMIMGDIEGSLKKESNIDSILAAAYQKIILKLGEADDINIADKPKVIFFVGPTGVGKTTTIAKIASRFKLEQQARVAFITSDTYRIAAVEQLNTYASIIDSPVSVIYSADELEEAVKEYKDYDLIMVDTAGRSHKSSEQMDELGDMLARTRALSEDFDVKVYLVLSITTKYKDLVNITERYKDIDDWSIIFTKLDETLSLGNILNIRMLTGASLSYTTSGQNVPNDIELINEQSIAKQLLGGNS
ncbi:MAG: flagellar biosynthesis protein FlhF [Lachnospira sp.]